MPCDLNIDLKSMQVNISKSVTKKTKSGVNIRNDDTGRLCLDALSTWRGCNGWEREAVEHGGKGFFDFAVPCKT